MRKKPHVSNGWAKWRSFKEPRSNHFPSRNSGLRNLPGFLAWPGEVSSVPRRETALRGTQKPSEEVHAGRPCLSVPPPFWGGVQGKPAFLGGVQGKLAFIVSFLRISREATQEANQTVRGPCPTLRPICATVGVTVNNSDRCRPRKGIRTKLQNAKNSEDIPKVARSVRTKSLFLWTAQPRGTSRPDKGPRPALSLGVTHLCHGQNKLLPGTQLTLE